jgi:hypothetical protein
MPLTSESPIGVVDPAIDFIRLQCRVGRLHLGAHGEPDDGIIRADRQIGTQRRSPRPPTKSVSTRSTSTPSKTVTRIGRWTNPSVIRLLDASGQTDPIAAITFLVRKVVVEAVERVMRLIERPVEGGLLMRWHARSSICLTMLP